MKGAVIPSFKRPIQVHFRLPGANTGHSVGVEARVEDRTAANAADVSKNLIRLDVVEFTHRYYFSFSKILLVRYCIW